KYLADNEPWKLIKTDEKRVRAIINISLQITANLAILCEPFLPFTSEKIFSFLKLSPLKWAHAKRTDNLSSGHNIGKEELLFEPIEDSVVQHQTEKLMRAKKANESSNKKVMEQKPETSFDDFSKMDIRTATILEAERVPKTDKLLKLKIDTGIDVRTIVSGIAQWYNPEDIIGRRIVMLANLAPRKIKGIESQGMILMAENPDGELSFVSPEKTNTINGAIVK
ncbi:MAG: methionine--tRNA ligase subunit beta, partial [Bacteroidota bacterium]